MVHIPVYQEWDILCEQYEPEEKVTNSVIEETERSRPTFAFRLQEARIKKRMTVFDLAEQLCIPPATLSKVESGLEMPPQSLMEKIQQVLQV